MQVKELGSNNLLSSFEIKAYYKEDTHTPYTFANYFASEEPA